MHKSQQDKSFAFDVCLQCEAVIHEHDRFCRHCGVDLYEHAEPQATANLRFRQKTRELNDRASAYATVPFAQNGRRPISGPLVKLLTTELTTPDHKRFVQRAMLVLIAFPIWLLMILLSPLDAYAAVKGITKQG